MEKLFEGRDAGRTFGGDEHAFLGGELNAGIDELFIAYGDGCAATVAHGFEDEEIAQRLGDAEAAGDSVGTVPKLAAGGALFEGADDWLAAGDLDRDHLGTLRADPSHLLHFGKGLPHADETDAAASGIEDDIGEAPAELFGELIAHGFLAFDSVGLFERADIEPALGIFAAGDDFGAIADEAIDQGDVRAVGFALDEVSLRDIARHEDVRFHSGGCGIGSEGAGGISSGGDGDFAYSEFGAHGYGTGESASLEAGGRVETFVLEPEILGADALAGAGGGEQGRHALAK